MLDISNKLSFPLESMIDLSWLLSDVCNVSPFGSSAVSIAGCLTSGGALCGIGPAETNLRPSGEVTL